MVTKTGLFALILTLASTKLITAYEQKEYRVTLSSETPKMNLFWSVDYITQVVNFRLEIQKSPQTTPSFTTIGVGMSERGQVTDADIVIMRFNDGSVDIIDTWSDESGKINADQQQDYHLMEYNVQNTGVTIAYRRNIDTKDTRDYPLDNGTTNLFYVIQQKGNDDSAIAPSTDEMFSTLWHNAFRSEMNVYTMRRESISVQILKPDIPASYFGNTENVSIFTIQHRNISLPAQITTYWCSTGRLPDFIQTKIHAIGFGANITQKNKDIVHHMEVFLCDPKDGAVTPYSGICNSKNEPSDVRRCNRVVGAWAKGAQDMFYPKEAGIPFGEPGETRYFRLEIHYHNPTEIVGLFDSSGMNFFYTNKLREYDAGILEIGVSYNENLAIPPRQKHFELKGVCPSACTNEGLASEGIHVFASQLHTHLSGRSVWISHYRGRNQLPNLNRDDHFQAMFQEVRQIYPAVDVLPGDSLVTHCSYNTEDRSNVTTTGDSLFQEMCISYLHYYPLTSLEVCKSSTSTQTLGEFFLLEKLFTGRPRVINFHELTTNYMSLKWTPQLVTELEITYESGTQDVECKRHNGEQLLGNWKNVDAM